MRVEVDVPPVVADRLNTASATRRWFPFSDDVIDWSVPLDGSWAYMPKGHSVLSGSGVLERLDPSDRSFVERWEMTQNMRNVGHGEHLLNQGILAMLWHVDPYDPSYRYLLHEVAEECQHMAMFNQWVRINDDIETEGAGEESWSTELSAFTEQVAVKLPESFWVNVLLFEFIGDEFNQAMRSNQNSPVGDDGRPLHPILVQIGITHTAEEARHIAYARRWLAEGVPRLDEDQLREVQGLAEYSTQLVIDRQATVPLRYGRQLAPFVSEEEFQTGLSTTPASLIVKRQLKKLVDEFHSLNIISDAAMSRWETAGAFA